MKIRKWLIVSQRGQTRVTAQMPSLEVNEVAMMLDIELPDAIFLKPRLEVKIIVPDEAVVPEIIKSLVVDNVQEAIEQATGLTFSIAVVVPEAE